MSRQVPELSLLSYVQGETQDKVRFVDGLFSGLKDYGFIILKDHTVDDQLIEKAYDLCHELFSLSEEKKQRYYAPDTGCQRGYIPFAKETAKGFQHPDLKEMWHIAREEKSQSKDQMYAANIWPQEIVEFKQTMTTLFNSLDQTAFLLLEALGKALDVPEDFFRSLYRQGNSLLRLIHYPPIPDKGFENSVRAAPHEDINLITILVAATDSGLELLDRDGKWLPVQGRPGQLVVDSADMLSRLTNEIIPSTTHRVINPPTSFSRSRYSMPFFAHPHPQAVLRSLDKVPIGGKKYEDITYHEFLAQRLKDIKLY